MWSTPTELYPTIMPLSPVGQAHVASYQLPTANKLATEQDYAYIQPALPPYKSVTLSHRYWSAKC